MRYSYLVLSATAAVATPVSFPLADNNFPNLNTTALQEVSTVAGGTIPNGALPTNISASGTQALQLIAANELFEVAYFSELLSNITNGVDGYEDATSYDVKMLTAVLAVRLSLSPHQLSINLKWSICEKRTNASRNS